MPGIVLPHLDGDHADRRHDVPDVARRADHLARHRQRHLAHHSVRHRRGVAVGDRRHARTRPPGRAVDRPDPAHHRDGGRGHRLHRVHGARAAPPADPVSQAPGRQPMFEGQSSHLPLKLNTSGVIPPIFASSLLLLPTTVANFNAGGGPGLADDDHDAARPRPAAVPDPLRRADRVLRVLLHRDRVQPDRDRRQSQEARRLHSGHSSGRAHGGIHRLCAVAHHRGRRAVSGDRLSHPGNPDLVRGGAVLLRRHLAADRGQRHDGYGRADPGLPAGAPV